MQRPSTAEEEAMQLELVIALSLADAPPARLSMAPRAAPQSNNPNVVLFDPDPKNQGPDVLDGKNGHWYILDSNPAVPDEPKMAVRMRQRARPPNARGDGDDDDSTTKAKTAYY